MKKSWLMLALTSAIAACNGQATVAQQTMNSSNAAPVPPTEVALRPSFKACVAESEGTTPGMQECMEEERVFHERRIQAVLKLLLVGGDRKAIEASQLQWQTSLAHDCSWNPKTDGEAKLVEADYCKMTRTATRADELEADLEDSN